MAKQIAFVLDIPAHLYQSYYQGAVRNVIAVSRDGRRVQFPAEHLRPFVTRDGVQGEFIIEFDDNHRFVAMRRIGPLPRSGQ